MSTINAAAGPTELVDWIGESNQYYGWKGFYASGEEHTLRVASLASFRSTWNGTDPSSQEILARLAAPHAISRASSLPSSSPFPPGREAALDRVAVPSPFLLAKTLGTFPTPHVPLPLVLVPPGPGSPAARSGRSRLPGQGGGGPSRTRRSTNAAGGTCQAACRGRCCLPPGPRPTSFSTPIRRNGTATWGRS